ncbi:MAG: helix-turn-helix domain-containing protein [Lentisphaeria bacterium]|nr:helix-turn-helix domain-containing protein [Lentisphaeria bacterium]
MKEHIIQLLTEELYDLSALTGTCCLWKYSPHLLTDPRLGAQRLHNCSFCLKFKEEKGENICVRHDTETLAGLLRSSRPGPQLVRCPAGAEEYLIPVTGSSRLLGAVLCGPFRGDSGAADLPLWRKELAPVLERCVCKRIAPLCRDLYLTHTVHNGNDPRIAAVIDYVTGSFADTVTLETAAQKVFLSPSRLSHLFKEKCGVDFSTFLTRLRVNEAEALLRDTACSIEEVALRSGFGDRSHFTSIFKKYNGLPPAKFRKKAREEISLFRKKLLNPTE